MVTLHALFCDRLTSQMSPKRKRSYIGALQAIPSGIA